MGGRANASRQTNVPVQNTRAPVREMLRSKPQFFGGEMTEHHHSLENGPRPAFVNRAMRGGQIKNVVYNTRDATDGF